MTLSGGTTEMSLSIKDSRSFGAKICDFNDNLGFIIRACGETMKKNVDFGCNVRA